MNDMKRLLSYAGPYKRDMIFRSSAGIGRNVF